MAYVQRQSMLAALLIPIVLGLGALSSLPVKRAVGALAYPYQLDNVEGYLLDEAVQLSRGQAIYTPLDESPRLVGNYPPGYQALFALFVRIGAPSLFFGRALCLSAWIGILLSMFLISVRCGGQWLAALLCPLLFAATYACHNWLAYARVDIPALFLSVAGLTLFLTEDSRGARRASLVFFVLGAMTKQTAMIAPAACAVFLFARDWRQGARFSLVFLGWVGGLTLLLTAWTRGQYVLHTIAYNVNTMNWGQLWKFWIPHLNRFYQFYLIGLILAFAFANYRLIRHFAPRGQSIIDETPPAEADAGSSAPSKRRGAPDFDSGERLAVVTIYFLMAALSVATLAKAGAAENYLLEPLAASALFFCAILGRALWESTVGRGAMGGRIVALAMTACLALHVAWLYGGNIGSPDRPFAPKTAMFMRATPSEHNIERANDLRRAIEAINGEVVCEDPVFLVLDDRRPPINPFILSQLAEEGTWDESDFVAEIEQGRFAAFITTAEIGDPKIFDRYTSRMVEALRAHYELYERFDLGRDGQTYFLYRPRRSPDRAEDIV
jgi:hypothetical protein